MSITAVKGVQREAEALGVEPQMEQRRAQELDDSVRQPKEKVRELERTAQAVLKEAARQEQEHTSIRDELLHFKVPLEQQVGSPQSRAPGEAVRPETQVGSSRTGADLLSP